MKALHNFKEDKMWQNSITDVGLGEKGLSSCQKQKAFLCSFPYADDVRDKVTVKVTPYVIVMDNSGDCYEPFSELVKLKPVVMYSWWNVKQKQLCSDIAHRRAHLALFHLMTSILRRRFIPKIHILQGLLFHQHILELLIVHNLQHPHFHPEDCMLFM